MKFNTRYGVVELHGKSGDTVCGTATLDGSVVSHIDLPDEEGINGRLRNTTMMFDVMQVMDSENVDEAKAKFVKKYERLLRQMMLENVHEQQ